MTHTLSNDLLTVSIQDAGAQLCSVRSAGGTEYLWQADPAVWGRHAPLLFPLIGRLQDSQYTLDGRAWSISTHGFARDAQFQVSEQGPTALSFQLEDSEETRRVYPFSFVLTVTYTLEGSRLTKAHRVENRSAVPMLYELGGHDGFRTPLEPGETMADYAVTISGVEELRPYGMDSRCMLTIGEARFPLEGGRIPLCPRVFGLDTIVLDLEGERRAALVDRSGRERVVVECPDFPYLGLWTADKPFDTGYFCIEPWSALPDAVFVGRGLEDKAGIRRLEPGGVHVLTYTTTFQ